MHDNMADVVREADDVRVDLFTDVAVSVCSACAEYVVSYYPSATTCAPKHSHRQPNKKPRKETCLCVRTA